MQKEIVYSLAAVLLIGMGAIAGATFASSETTNLPTENLANQEQEQQGTSPYAGQETREIKYLASDDVNALKHGKGGALGGLAKPAELNSYPGPRHVLDLSEELDLTAEQQQQIQSLFDEMQAEAQPLGQQFLNVEQEIDDAYAQGTMTDAELERLLKQSGDLYGQLRYVHLKYHFQTKDILTQEQIQKYDELRGYNSNQPMDHSNPNQPMNHSGG